MRLNGHKKFTFRQPGNSGIAHSEPEKIESFDFVSRMNELRQQTPMESNRQFLKSIGDAIDTVMIEGGYFAKSYRQISEYLFAELEDSIFQSINEGETWRREV